MHSPLPFPDVRSFMELTMLLMIAPTLIAISMIESQQRMTELIWMNTLPFKVPS